MTADGQQPTRTRERPLATDPDEFRRVGYALVDAVTSFLASLPERPVTTAEAPAAIAGMEALVEIVARLGREVDAELRPRAQHSR